MDLDDWHTLLHILCTRTIPFLDQQFAVPHLPYICRYMFDFDSQGKGREKTIGHGVRFVVVFVGGGVSVGGLHGLLGYS